MTLERIEKRISSKLKRRWNFFPLYLEDLLWSLFGIKTKHLTFFMRYDYNEAFFLSLFTLLNVIHIIGFETFLIRFIIINITETIIRIEVEVKRCFFFVENNGNSLKAFPNALPLLNLTHFNTSNLFFL
jgi:hypothetical protein